MTDYQTQFHNFRRRAVQTALRRLNPDPDVALDEREKRRALLALDHALDDDVAWPDVWYLLDKLAPKMEQAGHRNEWIPFLHQSIKLCQNLEEYELEATLALHLGYLHLSMHDYQKAHYTFEHCQKVFDRFGNDALQGKAINRLAMVALRRGHYASAKELAQNAMLCLPTDDYERWNSLYILGTVEYELGHPEDALQYLEESTKICRRSGSVRIAALGLRNLGPALRLTGRLEDAITCYVEAHRLLGEVGDPLNQAVVQMNLGIVESNRGDYLSAIKYYEQALCTFKDLQDTYNMAKAYVNMGIDYRALGQYDESELVILDSIRLSQQIGSHRELCNSMFELWETYLFTNQTDKERSALCNLNKQLQTMKKNPEMSHVVAKISSDIDCLQKRHFA